MLMTSNLAIVFEVLALLSKNLIVVSQSRNDMSSAMEQIREKNIQQNPVLAHFKFNSEVFVIANLQITMKIFLGTRNLPPRAKFFGHLMILINNICNEIIEKIL